MSAYATRVDLAERFGEDEISQREQALASGAVDLSLVQASGLIDGYISGRYSVPLTPVPDMLQQIACVIARYNLLGEAATERARNDYKDALAWLKDVQAAKVTLVGAATLPGNAPQATVLFSTANPVFKREGRP